MVWFLGALVLILLVAVALLARYVVRVRSDRKQRGLFGPWPVPKVGVDRLDGRFATTELGPSLDSEVRFLGRGMLNVPGGTTDTEAWILSVLAKNARTLFEFGTCTGKTAYLWAANCPPEGKVFTLTLAPDQVTSYQGAAEDDPEAAEAAKVESAFTRFVYSDTPVAGKVAQLYGDSKTFDETPYRDACDLVFVDGSHAYTYVKSDSEKALRMVRPGGVVLWHDYCGPRRAKGVFRCLNELAARLPLMHLAGTSLVAYRRPEGS